MNSSTLATQSQNNPIDLLTPGRKITGMSAILLPFNDHQQVAWDDFNAHLSRTWDAGLTPVINMDTGFANLIDEQTRQRALQQAEKMASGREFIAGAFVADQPGDRFNLPKYIQAVEQIHSFHGTPILFQSYGLTHGDDSAIATAYHQIAEACQSFLAFELGSMFAPFGKIYSLSLYEQLMQIPNCRGAKHSSLRRDLEWQRLRLRNQIRPDFMVLTGNDLAIDMIMYGSDYLLGLSTFAPEAFAKRDSMWASGNDGFYQLNDLLQYLGAFAFRDPVPAYKHSAAMFLHLQGLLETNKTHPLSPCRPDADLSVLRQIAADLESMLRN